MEKKNNVLLKIINVVLFIVLIIVMVLYFDARKNAKLNLESLLIAAEEAHSANTKINELEDKLKLYENEIQEDPIIENNISITATNTISNNITSTSPYIPDGMKVADPNDNSDIKASDIILNCSPENVTIEVLKETVTNKSLEIVITDNNEDYYGWGADFKIQEKVNNEWVDLGYISNDVSWIEIAYVPDENNQIKQKINIEKYYGELDPGIYRVVKTVYNNEYIDIWSDEFEINEK